MKPIDYIKLAQSFEALTLNPATFTHKDHVGVAYVMLRQYDFITASHRYAKALDAIATAAGVPEKFHVTTTLACLSLIAEKMSHGHWNNAQEFMQSHPELLSTRILEQHYQPERLQSESARSIFLLP